MYRSLKGTGRVVEFIGLLVCVASLFFLLYGLASAVDNRWPAGVIIASLIPTLIGVGVGILVMAQGQQILCFVSIEENTRKTFVAVEDLISRIADDKRGHPRQALFAGLQLREPEVEARRSQGAASSETLMAGERTTCTNCGKTFQGNLRGEYCEECGTQL